MKITHAGGVVVREDGGERRYLLARSSRAGQHWVLPKGHIDPGEEAEEAALREVREETGVIGEIVERIGLEEYVFEGEEVRSLFFAMRFVEEGEADEDRETAWLGFEEACETVTFEGARHLIERAHKVPLGGPAEPAR